MKSEYFALQALKVIISCNEQLDVQAAATIMQAENITEMKSAFSEEKTWEKYETMLGTINMATKNSYAAGKLEGMGTR